MGGGELREIASVHFVNMDSSRTYSVYRCIVAYLEGVHEPGVQPCLKASSYSGKKRETKLSDGRDGNNKQG